LKRRLKAINEKGCKPINQDFGKDFEDAVEKDNRSEVLGTLAPSKLEMRVIRA